ncbi:MAG: hypothetical protein OEV94_06370 [Deltaproteobacteria bacterium]|nr:hypothetical protein [Deltaproteobacteria bacterium]
MAQQITSPQLFLLGGYGVALGVVAATAELTLRQVNQPGGAALLPLAGLIQGRGPEILQGETWREAAIVVLMFLPVWLVLGRWQDRIMAFLALGSLSGVTRLVVVKQAIGWPTSPEEFDLLGVFPTLLAGPVWAVMAMYLLVGLFSLLYMYYLPIRIPPVVHPVQGVSAALGGVLLFWSFVGGGDRVLAGTMSGDFSLILYSLGFFLVLGGGGSYMTVYLKKPRARFH